MLAFLYLHFFPQPLLMATIQTTTANYRARFAPSPTGPLHLGSLSTALGSYLDAKYNHGIWLLRIEDIDPPREASGAKDIIPRQLEAHGLEWDDAISYQSENSALYREALSTLQESGLTYPCICSRQQIKLMGGIYDRTCLNKPPKKDAEFAIRLEINGDIAWRDLIRGQTNYTYQDLGGDFVLRRKEGLFSYQLAVAIDDKNQNITRVVRGADLMDSTARQLHIFKSLNLKPPMYAHLPVLLSDSGQKLSKQNQAPPLESNTASENIYQSLVFLGQNPSFELSKLSVSEILSWAIKNWDISKVPTDDSALGGARNI